MRRQLLEYIRCPVCKGSFSVIPIHENEIEIENGVLVCESCGFTSEFSDGIVNLLYTMDPATMKELYIHVSEGREMFEAELRSTPREELEHRWAYMENHSSKEYGKAAKEIFWNALRPVTIRKDDVVLDLGIGTGWSTAQLAKMSNCCIGIDLCKPIKLELSRVFIGKDQVYFERCMANMMRLPIKDHCIDKVVCMASLHHASDPQQTMYEISRVLKEGGELILIGEQVVPGEYIGKDEGFVKEKEKGLNEHQYTAEQWFIFAEKAGLSAKDGTTSSGDLKKYYQVDDKNLQTPLPIFKKSGQPHIRPLTIALVSQEYAKDCTGGICRYTYDLAHGLASLGNEVHIISKSDIGSEYEESDGGVLIHRIVPRPPDGIRFDQPMQISQKNLSYSYAVCEKLLDLIEKYRIQIVEAPLWDAEGFVFSLVKPVPLVIRIETPLFKVFEIQQWDITPDIRVANWMEGETARTADKVIAISEGISRLVCHHHRIDTGRVVVSPLGITAPPGDSIPRHKKNERFKILFVGRLEKRKGIETLFRAIPLIVDQEPAAHFAIVGKDSYLSPEGGPYASYLMNHLDPAYHSNVDFAGYVPADELDDFYKECDIFVAPSLYESFGLIFLEAMAWGKPVIGCNVGGIPEIIRNNENGFLIEPDDHEALAEKILELRDEMKRESMGRSGRNDIETKFSMAESISSTLRIYHDVCSNMKDEA